MAGLVSHHSPRSVCTGTVVLALFFLLLSGCPSDVETSDESERASVALVDPLREETTKASTPNQSEKQGTNESDAALDQNNSLYQYEKQLPLAGTVRFKLMGRCTGCSGGTLEAEAKIRGNEIELLGEVAGCEGSCPNYYVATGTVTIRRLERTLYTVRSKLQVLEVEPLTLSAQAQAEWAVFLMNEDCTVGIESLNGNESVTSEYRTKFNQCFSEVSPDIRFQTISNMLSWKNRESYVPELIQALGETKTAYLAARVLGRTKNHRALGPLIEALGTNDESLRWDAARSLEMITDEEFGQDQARWKAWYSQQVSQ